MKKRFLPSLGLLLSSWLLAQSAHGATGDTWSGATSADFEIGTNWSGGTPASDTATNYAIFTGTPSLNQPALSASRSLAGLQFGSTGGWTFGGAFTLTLGNALTVGSTASVGLDASALTGGTDNLSVGTVTLNAAQSWLVGTGGTLNVTSAVLGASTKILTYGDAADGGTMTLGGTAANTGLAMTVLAGTVYLSKTSSATVYAADGNGTTGSLKITGGTVMIAGTGGNQIADAAVVTLNGTSAAGGTLDLNGNSETIAGLNANSGSVKHGTVTNSSATAATLTLSNNTANALIYSGTITGNLNLIVNGTGSQSIGADTFTGTTSAAQGTLILNTATSLLNSTLSMDGGTVLFGQANFSVPTATLGGLAGSGNLALTCYASGSYSAAVALTVGNNNATTSYNGVLSGLGSLAKAGTGKLILAGVSTYSGGTLVNGGTLLVTNTTGSGTGTGAVAVAGGATLGGSGTITGAVTVASGGILLAGSGTSAAETLTLSGSTTVNDGAGLEFVLGASGAHSTLALNGALTLPTNLSFTFLNLGGTTGFYDNLITGVAASGATGSWTFTDSGYVGTFAYDGSGNIDLTLTSVSVPEPGTGGLLLGGVLLLAALGRRLRRETAFDCAA